MIFDNRGTYCIFEVLKLLSKGKSKYSIMFKTTRVSHSTLQLTLKNLIDKNFIKKDDIGHKQVDYEITEKGMKLFNFLVQLKNILKF